MKQCLVEAVSSVRLEEPALVGLLEPPALFVALTERAPWVYFPLLEMLATAAFRFGLVGRTREEDWILVCNWSPGWKFGVW